MVVYFHKDSAQLSEFLRDLQGFFGKFPIPLEIICVLEKNSSIARETLEKQILVHKADHFSFVIIENKKSLGRAQSVVQGFNQAKAPFLAPLHAELATPLGDILKLLQNLIGEEHLALTVGDRYKKKEHSFLNRSTPRARTENLFRPIFLEKNKNDLQDPLCESFVIKKEAWNKISNDLLKEANGWYLAPYLHRALRKHQLKWQEVFLHDNGRTSDSYVPWKQKLRLFSLSLKK